MTSALIVVALLTATGCSSRPVTHLDAGHETESEITPLQRFGKAVLADYQRAYSQDGMLRVLPHLGVHAALSNSNTDRWIRDEWQGEWRSENGDDFFHKFERVGDYAQNRWSVPLYSLGMIAGGYTGLPEDSWLATWASRSLRANILAGPQGWALTYMLGTHRPDVGHSGWNPWNDNDGVSGHSIYGSIPFLTAARMAESPAWRYTLFAASVLPPLARVNFNDHYTSQAYLGWALAFTATATIAATEEGRDVSWMLLPAPGGAIASLRIRF